METTDPSGICGANYLEWLVLSMWETQLILCCSSCAILNYFFDQWCNCISRYQFGQHDPARNKRNNVGRYANDLPIHGWRRQLYSNCHLVQLADDHDIPMFAAMP